MSTLLSLITSNVSADVTGMQAIISGLKAGVGVNGGSSILSNDIQLTQESMVEKNADAVGAAAQALRQVVTQARVDSKLFTQVSDGNAYLTQEAAAVTGMMLASNPSVALAAAPRTFQELSGLRNETTSVVGLPSSIEGLSQRSLTQESYDNSTISANMVYTAAYNLFGSRQDPLGEAFYPTVTIDASSAGFVSSIDVIYLQDDFRRNTSGALDKYNRKNLLHAMVDPDFIRGDTTKIVPFYRTTNPDNSPLFAAEVGVANVIIDGEAIPTAPLAFGKEFSLLGLSQNAATLATGQLDTTDQVAPGARLKALFVKLTAGATTEYFRVDTRFMNGNDMVESQQDNTRRLQLVMNTDAIVFNKEQLTAAGTPSTILTSAIVGTKTIILGASVTGSITLDTSNTQFLAGPLSVKKVREADATGGSDLDFTTAGAAKTAADLFATATLVGYELDAYRSNTNLRQRGQLADRQTFRYVYQMPLLAPVTALRAITQTDANDAAVVNTLLQTTYARTSAAAIRCLEDTRAFLKGLNNTAGFSDDLPSVLGIASKLMAHAYFEDEIDCATDINSLSTSDRADDLNALLLNRIRDIGYQMLVKSAWPIAAAALNNGAEVKPLLIVGCDPYVERYLTQQGDTRTITENFDVRIVSSYNKNMRGKIYLGLGDSRAYNSNVPCATHNGNMGWKPEITVSTPMTQNGAQSFRISVSPSFRHVQNVPALGYIVVKNIDKVIARNVAVATNEVP